MQREERGWDGNGVVLQYVVQGGGATWDADGVLLQYVVVWLRGGVLQCCSGEERAWDADGVLLQYVVQRGGTRIGCGRCSAAV